MSKELCYAIDFGTSNSLLSAASAERTFSPIELDRNNSDSTILRSLMYFPKVGQPSFGSDAIAKYVEEAAEGRFIRSIKKYLPVESFVSTSINNQPYKLEEIISRFLSEMKKRADSHFEQNVTKVILGRPARFSDNPSFDQLAQDRLMEAAKLAGFEHIDFLPEPLAAAYSYLQQISSEKILLVVDLGGGTSDYTVVKIRPNIQEFDDEDVLAIGGVSIAGDAIDGSIMWHRLSPHFGAKVQYQFPMSKNVLTMPASLRANLCSPADITLMSRSDIMHFLREVQRCRVSEDDQIKIDQLMQLISENLGFALYEKIEGSKREVCETGQTTFEYINGDIDVSEPYNYQEFLEFGEERLEKIFDSLQGVLQQAQVSAEQIDLICCTGGTSKIPAIKDKLVAQFGADKISTFKNFHSVIEGLAQKAKLS